MGLTGFDGNEEASGGMPWSLGHVKQRQNSSAKKSNVVSIFAKKNSRRPARVDEALPVAA